MANVRSREALRLEELENADRPQRVLLAASTGGHLAQLFKFSQRWNISTDSLWVTFDSPQSRSLLRGRRVLWVPYVAPRDLKRVVSTSRIISEVLKDEPFDLAVSTGAALALGVLPIARMKGVPAVYLESVSRVNGPSLTGQVLKMSRLTELRTQHQAWADKRWLAYPSVLTQFYSRPRTAVQPISPTIFVTLGTIQPYRFDALVDSVLASGLAGPNTVWQLGETTRPDLPGTVLTQTSASDFHRYATEADIVVTHAGVGTILNFLDWGIYPVVVPRRKSRNEHIDDHQLQIASLMEQLAIGHIVEAPNLDSRDLLSAMKLENVAFVE